MLATTSPLSGWVLDRVVELDLHAPGFAGRYLRSSNERRQVVAACLAARPTDVGDQVTARETADFLALANHRNILHRAYGSVPCGFRGALGRSGAQPHEVRFYTLLHEMLSKPPHVHIIPAINHLPELDLTKLRVARALPSGVCAASVIKVVGTVAAARDIGKVLDLFVRNGVDRDALFEAVRRVGSGNELAGVWKRWTLRTVFADHPVSASEVCRPITTAADLRLLAQRYRNCAERYVSSCLDGADAFAEALFDNRGVVVHLRRYEGVWMVEDLFGRHNSRPHPDLRAKVLAHLREQGIEPKPRRVEESGEWAVLHRLWSQGLFDLEEDD